MHIGIDLMGSESSPLLLFSAVLKAAELHTHDCFIVFVDFVTSTAIHSLAIFNEASVSVTSRLQFIIAEETITMQDAPLIALKEKKNSSLVQGLQALQQGLIHALVTAGNTGALIVGATLFLKLIKGIKRPALLANLPTLTGKVVILDVGGNVECRASQLIQFAKMGIAYHQSQFSGALTKLGLLNIGTESVKGTTETRKAYDFFQQNSGGFPHVKFLGNIEGNQVFEGKVNVLVTNGFVGNVLLKTAEGVYALILKQLHSVLDNISEIHSQAILQSLRSEFDCEEVGGALVCGLESIVIKCHGNVTDKGFFNAILECRKLVSQSFIDKIKRI